jgi:hypothetical protein
VEQAASQETARADRAVGGGQDVARARGCGGLATGRLGDSRVHAGRSTSARAGARARAGAVRGRRGAGEARRHRRPGGGLRGGEPVAQGTPRGAGSRGPVRGAVHSEPGTGAGSLRGAPGPPGARGGRARPAFSAGRLPDPLLRARLARARVPRPDAAARAEPGRAAPSAGGAGGEAGLPLRGRRAGRGDGGFGGGHTGGAAAARLRRVAAVGEAGPREEAADARYLRGDRRCGRGASSARGGDARPDRDRAPGDGPRDLPQPRHVPRRRTK